MARYEFVEDEIEEPVQTEQSPIIKDTAPSKGSYEFIEEEKPSEIETFKENVKDIAKQAPKETLAGALGSYGDILDLFGLQSKKINPGERAQYELEANARPEDLPHLVDTEDVLPRYSKLPSSEETSQFIEELGGPGKPKTLAGRFSKRGGRFVGSGLAFGQTNALLNLGAGIAGQAAEELGASPWIQAAVELGTFLKGSKSKSPITSNSPEIAEEIKRLKSIGFSDQDITLAKNALEDRGWLKKTSQFTQQAEKKFKESAKGSEKKFESILEDSFPGLKEGGPGTFKQASSELFNSLDELAQGIVVENPEIFVNESNKAIANLERTLAKVPQKKQVVELLEEANKNAYQGLTADYYTNFYKDLNSVGQWGNPKQREHVFSLVKDAIKNTFKAQGPEGKKLASSLEDANKSWMKYLQAEDISNLTQKAMTDEGMNFSKMYKMLQNPENFQTFSKGIGKEQTQNLKQIVKTGQDIKDLKQVMKGGLVKEALGAGKLYAIGKAVVTLDWKSLAGYVGAQVAGKTATKFLIDPKYQNLQLKLLNAVKEEKWNSVRVITKAIEKRIDRESSNKGPNQKTLSQPK